jgi:hypothetical protein
LWFTISELSNGREVITRPVNRLFGAPESAYAVPIDVLEYIIRPNPAVAVVPKAATAKLCRRGFKAVTTLDML